MTNVVHLPLSRELRKGSRVLDEFNREGVIVGFTRGRTWAFRKPVPVSWVIVELPDGHRRYHRANELRVVESSMTLLKNETEA